MFEFNAECYGILQVHPDQASRPRYHVVDWSDTYFKKKMSVIIVFLVNDGLFEHFLIKKTIINVEIREIENIQILFWTHMNVLFRTCYRMYSYVKFKAFFLFLPKNNRNPQKGAWWFHWVPVWYIFLHVCTGTGKTTTPCQVKEIKSPTTTTTPLFIQLVVRDCDLKIKNDHFQFLFLDWSP